VANSLLSQTAEYALRAAVRLATHPDQAWTTREISDAALVPAGYLAKILSALTRAEIITSQRGPGGGFRLRRSPSEVTLLDVINAVDPLQRIESCPLGLEWHGDSLCPLHARLDDAIARVEESFRTTTLAAVTSPAGHPFCGLAPQLSPGPARAKRRSP
jgi:Rrf2 family protein